MSESHQIEPTHLRDYLLSQGWSLVKEALADRLYLFQKASIPRRQLAFPMDVSASDYGESVDIALGKLGELTGQVPSSLIWRVRAFGDDV